MLELTLIPTNDEDTNTTSRTAAEVIPQHPRPPRYARRAAANHRRSDGLRRQRRRSVPNSEGVLLSLADPKPSPLERVERAEAVRGILGAIPDLPPRQREAVEALDLRSERLVDAAARLRRTPGALRSDRWRGRHALREALINGADRAG